MCTGHDSTEFTVCQELPDPQNEIVMMELPTAAQTLDLQMTEHTRLLNERTFKSDLAGTHIVNVICNACEDLSDALKS